MHDKKGMLWITRVDNRELSDAVSDEVEDVGGVGCGELQANISDSVVAR